VRAVQDSKVGPRKRYYVIKNVGKNPMPCCKPFHGKLKCVRLGDTRPYSNRKLTFSLPTSVLQTRAYWMAKRPHAGKLYSVGDGRLP